jgi:hypothetical protein
VKCCDLTGEDLAITNGRFSGRRRIRFRAAVFYLSLGSLIVVGLAACGDTDDDASSGGSMEIVSDFNADDEGWMIVGDATETIEPLFEDAEGDSGIISGVDKVDGDVWYFRAPELFYGDRGGCYGRNLKFRLRQDSARTNQFEAPDVLLMGAGLTLAADLSPNPEPDWTQYSVRLDDATGWTLATLDGAKASESDIRNVLGSLEGLEIRGEYETGPDTGSLDNVTFCSLAE